MRRAARAAAVAALGLLLAGRLLHARQEESGERDGTRRRRPAPSGTLLLPVEERAPAPAIPPDLVWLQGAPPDGPERAGRAVLVEFWEFTCVNCLRVLPLVSELHARYGPSGLVVIGIHAPDFGFSAEPEVVKAAVARLGIRHAILNDPAMAAWRAFDNNGWPSAFLIDGRGRLAWRGEGEAAYVRLEDRVRALLAEQGLRDLPPPSGVHPPEPDAARCGETTPEVLLGDTRGALANVEGYDPGRQRTYQPGGIVPPEGQPLLAGPWVARADGLTRGEGGPASLTLVYEAKEVYAVIRPTASGSHRVEVTQDGVALSPEIAGDDVVIDAKGRSRLTVDAPRLYAIARNAASGPHRLTVEPGDSATQLVSFSFGDACQSTPSRR